MIDLEHILYRLVGPFDPESRYYWPLAVALLAALAVNVAWFYWRQRGPVAAAERGLRPWALWLNVAVIVWLFIVLIAKLPFLVVVLTLALNLAALAYMYLVWLPPREAAWVREQRRLRYIPRAERRERRRR